MSGADRGRRVRVLHVDGDPATIRVVEQLLTEADDRLSVTGVTDAETGLERLATAEPGFDCVLSHYQMPGVDGLRFLAQVRERHPRVPFLLYTSQSSDELAAEAVAAGVTDYVRKGSTRGHFTVLSNRIVTLAEGYHVEREHDHAVAALEAAREALCVVDADGTVAYANAAYGELYGRESAAIVGEPWVDHHPGEEAEHVVQEVLPVAELEGGWQAERPGERADGSTFRESRSVTPLEDGGFVVAVSELVEDADGERVDPIERTVPLLDRALDAGAVDGETATLTRETRGRLAEQAGNNG